MGAISSNDFQYPLNIFKNLIVPESEDLKTKTGQTIIPLHVFFYGFSVLPTVQFDNQLLLKAYKINDVFFDRLLSSKFNSLQLGGL